MSHGCKCQCVECKVQRTKSGRLGAAKSKQRRYLDESMRRLEALGFEVFGVAETKELLKHPMFERLA